MLATSAPSKSAARAAIVSRQLRTFGTVEQESRRVGCEQRLAPLLLSVVGPALHAGGQPADADRSDEVDGEDDPVLGVGEPKRVHRRQEEPVEDEHADDGDRHGVGQAPEGRHRQHREDVQAAEADDRSERVEDEDGTAHDCDGAEAEEAGDEVAAPGRLDQEKSLGAKTVHRRRIGAGPKTPSRFPEWTARRGRPSLASQSKAAPTGQATTTQTRGHPSRAAKRPEGFDAAKRVLVGRPRASGELDETLISKTLALPIFASDPLSSVAYATEAAMVVLVAVSVAALHLVLPISIAIAAVLAIVVVSYTQTVRAYETSGGAYVVAKDNLGTLPSLVAAAALLVDYVLTVAVSVTAGVLALTSAAPSLALHKVGLSLGFVALLTIVNLRGVRESGSSSRSRRTGSSRRCSS